MRLRIRVTPRSSKDEVIGTRDGVVLVRVTAPPEGGKANAKVCKVIAKALGVPPTSVSVTRGASAREKTIEVAGVEDEDAARAALGL